MATTQNIRLFSCGHELDPAAGCLGTLDDCSGLLDDPQALGRHLAEEGYLYLPGCLDVEEVLGARGAIADRLSAIGVLDPQHPSIDAIAHPQYSDVRQHELAQKVPQLEKLLYAGRMMRLFERLLGGPVRHYDYTWLRVVAPGKGTEAHCDIVYMGRGTPNLQTRRMRLSSDSRYQLAAEPADERWIGENPVAHGAAGKREKIC